MARRLVKKKKRGFEGTQESDIYCFRRPTVFTLDGTNGRLIRRRRDDQTRSAVDEGVIGMGELPRKEWQRSLIWCKHAEKLRGGEVGRGGVHLGNLLISGWKTLISTQSCRKAPGGVGLRGGSGKV